MTTRIARPSFTVDRCPRLGKRLIVDSPPPSWFDQDIWSVIMKFLNGRSLIRLALVNRAFYHMVTEEDVWKAQCIRELKVPLAPAPQFSWRRLYASLFDGTHSYSFHNTDKHIDWIRIGLFCIKSGEALVTERLSELASILRNEKLKPQCEPFELCSLSNVRLGMWIADLHLVRCPVCDLVECEGTMQTLEARHWELFLHKEYQNGEWTFEEVHEHIVPYHCDAAAGGIFDAHFLKSQNTQALLDLKSWVAKLDDLQPRVKFSLYAAAASTNLQENEGLQVKIQYLRGGKDGQILSIRISQQLI